jgi:uncharacterized protein
MKGIIRHTISIFLLSLFVASAQAQEIPDLPDTIRLVTDYTGTLTKIEKNQLERKLVMFDDTTSSQIAIVVVDSFNGLTKEEFADRLAEKWGIGRKGKNNGVLILLKPKTSSSKGEVRISVGYGLEGAIPDAIGKRIVENEMIPYFRNNDYFTGLDKATSTLMSLATGEFTADEYKSRTSGGGGLFIVPFLVIIIIISILRSRSRRYYGTGSRGSGLLTGLLLGSMLSNRGSSGSWNNFNSGSGGFGGGGGFGGFGGGSFGGGGAGGSW